MKYLYIASTFLALTSVASANDAALQACVEVYKSSTRNYSQQQQTNIELARSFSSFCKKDGSTNTSAKGVGLDAVVYSIPFKFSADSQDSSQKLVEFCKVGQSQYQSWDQGSLSTSTVETDALANFNNCINLANSGLQLVYAVSQPDKLVVSGSANPGYSGDLTSIAYDDQSMTCVSSDFSPDHTPQPLHDAVHIKITDPFAITCTKKAQPALGGFAKYYPRTTLTLTASAVSPLAIVFPSDTLNGYELASQASVAVSEANSVATAAMSDAAFQKSQAETLQHRLSGVTAKVVTHKFGDGTPSSCFGHGAHWGDGLIEEAKNVCGANNFVTSNNDVSGGGSCGFGATAYACIIVPPN